MVVERFQISGVAFTVEKIADSPDYRYPVALVNTHRVTWVFGERTGTFTCITYYNRCYELAGRITQPVSAYQGAS